MNLDMIAKRGRLAWSPNPDVQDLDVWDEYGHPRVGTFTVRGETVFFMEAAPVEDSDRLSVWAYGCLTSEEAKDLATAEFDSAISLHEFGEKLLEGRKLVFALADDLLIERWSVVEGQGPLLDLAITFLNTIVESVKQRQDPSAMVRAKLAQLDVATNELVDA